LGSLGFGRLGISWVLRTVCGDASYIPSTKEGFIMDAHFHEYLAAIAGMHDIYGDVGDDHPSEFHEPSESCAADAVPAAVVESGAAFGAM
jgi:hypothetical protein